MQEEQDTCRICSAPAEPDQPLYYPCKCSGTIRYIHQDCLTTWLAHSKKKTCDVCKYPYSFTKVYSPNMPSRLPMLLLVRRFAQQTGYAVLFALRAVMVGLIWLAFLPWATIWTWRMYFTMGDSTAWWISNRPRPTINLPLLENATTSAHNDTIVSNITNATSLSPVSFFSHPVVRAVSSDIVAGQIIATVIVVAFVAIFLLREWISQNARPGVFDDAEPMPPAEVPPQPPLRAHGVGLRQRAQEFRARAAERAVPVPAFPPGVPEVAQRDRDAGLDADLPARIRNTNDQEEATAGKWRKGKGKLMPERANKDVVSGLSIGAKRRRHSWNGLEVTKTDGDEPHFATPEEFVRQERAGLRSSTSGESVPTLLPNVSESQQLQGQSASLDDSSRLFEKSPNRPPLFSTALFPPNEASSSRIGNSFEGDGETPLASPSLATYRAPEELEAGPSRTSSYFTGGVPDDDNVEYDEYNMYFHKPGDVTANGDTGSASGSGNVNEDVQRRPEPEEDLPMPALAQWTDDEFDEPEDDDRAILQLDGPFDMEGGPDDDDPFNDNDNRQDGDIQVVDGMNDDDLDVGMDDDMEGALEAIGLRGPIQSVLQNAALMIFVLDTTIGVGVWLPFTIGKALALLSLDPRRLLYILHFPIRAIRIVTDPIVDSVMFLFMRMAVPPLIVMGQVTADWFSRILSAMIGDGGVTRGAHLMTNLYNRILEVTQNGLVHAQAAIASSPEASAGASPLQQLIADDSAFMRVAAPYFAPLGQVVRVMQKDARETWTKLAIGDGTPEKLFAIALGYLVAMLLIAIYLNVLTVGSMKNAGRAVRSAVRQQLVVVKVATFIIIELIVFPLGCGVMLDICSVSLFPQGSFRARAEFLLYAPLTAAFYHWVIGTMFMYQFAVLLAGFRSCLRSGALWFIKDPQDQNFHPIRDILERPTLVHVRKLLLSAVMYGMVVACGVGTVSGMLRIFSKTIMPFRWKVREPMSAVPVDLLFLHMVLPYTLQYFRPKKFVKQGGLHAWKFIAHHLRLTSYLFGGRHPDEEYSLGRWTLHALVSSKGDDVDVLRDGTFRRVPNSDNVALAKDESATAEVHEDGKPIDEKQAELMKKQDEEAEKAKRNIRDDYTIAYIPPNFRYRVILFIIALWMVCSVVLSACLAVPILLGRYFFQLFIPHHVHDGYAFIAGFYLLWGCWIASTAIERMDRHRQRRGGNEPRADFPLYFLKAGTVWLAQVSYMAVFLGFIIPTLMAVVVELYLVMPFRQTLQPELQPRIRVVDMWALGLMYTKVALRAQRIRPMGRISRGIDQIRRHGWTHPQPLTATKEVIAPIVGGLVGMIVLPPAILWVMQRVFHLHADQNLLFLHIYPTIFTFTAFIQGFIAVASMIRTWSQAVRDKEFLVEMRLQNLEPETKNAEVEAAEVEDVTLGDEEDDE